LLKSWFQSGRGRAAEMTTGGESNTWLLCFRGSWGGGYPRQELCICRSLATTTQNDDLLNPDLFSLFLISNCYLLAQGAPRKA